MSIIGSVYYWAKYWNFFSVTFWSSETILPMFVRVPCCENMAFLTNLSTPWTNGKVLDHEKCFVPNIQLGIFKNYQNFRPLFFYGYMRDGGRSVPPPLAQIELMPHSSIFFLIILGALNIVWLISCCATIFRTAAASSLSLPNFRHPTSQN